MADPRRLTLVTGGARSGKSRWAEHLAATAAPAGRVLYVATAQAFDEEMTARIAAHRATRPATWRTLEAPIDVAAALAAHRRDESVALLEDLGLLVSNLLLAAPDGEAGGAVELALTRLLDWWASTEPPVHLIVVSQEVGLGVVPPSPLGRAFRDLLGWANQRLAAHADAVYLVAAGFALDLRRLGAPVPPDPAGTD